MVDRGTAGVPSAKVIAGGAILIVTSIFLGFAIYHLLAGGTCSSTGYSSNYGPVPHCSKSQTLFGFLLPVCICGAILGGWLTNTQQTLMTPLLFCAIGVGALFLGIEPPTGNGSESFALIFGGCFFVGGVGSGIFILRKSGASPSRWGWSRPEESPAWLSPRAGLAGLVWAGAGTLAVGLGLLAGSATSGSTTGGKASGGSGGSAADITRTRPARDNEFVSTSATDLTSLFKPFLLSNLLRGMERRFGSDVDVVQLVLYPEQLDLVIVTNGQARLVTADPGGVDSVSAPRSFAGSRQSVAFSQIVANVPHRLAREIAQRDGVRANQIGHFQLDLQPSLAHWRIYTTSGTVYTALLTGSQLERIASATPQAPAP